MERLSGRVVRASLAIRALSRQDSQHDEDLIIAVLFVREADSVVANTKPPLVSFPVELADVAVAIPGEAPDRTTNS